MGYIYVIENIVNHKKYVGQTIDPEKRWRKHKTDDIKNPNLVIGRAFLKYGTDNFTFSILEECDNSELSIREQFWIKKLNTFIGNKDSNGYNMTRGGESMFGDSNPFYGKHHSDEVKQKISEFAKTRIGEDNPFYGKHHTQETKDLLSKLNRGRKHTPEELEKMSKIKMGEKNYFYGKHHTQETKEKIRKSRLGKLPYNAVPYTAKNDIGKSIYFESIGKIFNWIKENKLESDSFTLSMLKNRLKKSIKNKSKYLEYYWYKSVETIPDECKEVGSEIDTDSKCTASTKENDEEIVHNTGNSIKMCRNFWTR